MTFEVTALPHWNAALNALVFLLLLRGWWHIRHGRRERHRQAMLGAFAGSVVFLVSYLTYHFAVGSVRFPGTGGVRTLYLGILLTHTVLAAAILPLVLVTLRRALRQDFGRHRSLARVTLPLWAYVSVTGVVVYWMLYRL